LDANHNQSYSLM